MIETINTSPCITGQTVIVATEHNQLSKRDDPDCHPILAITDLQQELDGKLNLSGGTLTGALFLDGTVPSSPFQVADKAYVDAIGSGGSTPDAFVIRAGDTMSGFLTLSDSPVLPYHAVTKEYFESQLNAEATLHLVKDPETSEENVIVIDPGITALSVITAGSTSESIMSINSEGTLELGDTTKSGSVVPLLVIRNKIVGEAPDPKVNMIEAYGWDGDLGFTVAQGGAVVVGGNPYQQQIGVAIANTGHIAINSASDVAALKITQTEAQTADMVECLDDTDGAGFTVTKNADVLVGGNPYSSQDGVFIGKKGALAINAAYESTSHESFKVYRSGGDTSLLINHEGTLKIGDGYTSGGGMSIDKYGKVQIRLKSTGGQEALKVKGWSGSYPDFVVTEKGNVIVGRNSYSGYAGVVLTAAGSMRSSGECKASNFVTSSDRRLKENIIDIQNESNAILNLTPTLFTIKTSKISTAGLIAQEVKGIYPDAVSEDEGDGMLSIDYNYINTMLLSYIQKLEKRVRILENRP